MIDKELTVLDIIQLIQELKRLEASDVSKDMRTEIFNKIPKEFKIKVCLGCGGDYEDCDCPAGSSERLRKSSKLEELLQRRKVSTGEENG